MSNNLILNRLFTIATFQKLISATDSNIYLKIVDRYVDTKTAHTNGEAIEQVYNYLRKQYRNQYYYKNTILNKLLLGVHSINTTTALTEVAISTSKADFVLINGKAVVYEIKTELDNLERLEGQINDYYKAFDHICVLTCDEYASVLQKRFSESNVGIYVLTKNETIKRIKEPTRCDSFIDSNVVFKILNKPEFENILLEYYGELPITSQVKFYSTCRDWFLQIPKEEAYKLFLKVLKERNAVEDKRKFESVPYELKSLAYFSQYCGCDYENLEHFLADKIGGGI